MHNQLDQWLELRKSQGLFRTSKPPSLTADYKSNDYYGLSTNEDLAQDTEELYKRMKRFGSGSSRMVAGYHSALSEVENQLADRLSTPAATLFGSGYMSNLALADILKFLSIPVFSAIPNHRSLIQAVQLSKQPVHLFDPFDLLALEHQFLEFFNRNYERRPNFMQDHQLPFAVVTESVFSMSGRHIDLTHLLNLQSRYGFFLIIDDAHGFGVGQTDFSKSLSSMTHWEKTILAFTGSKSLGSAGGILLSSESMKKLMENICSPLIYSTATHPYICCQLLTHLNYLLEKPNLRQELWANISEVQDLFLQKTDSPILALPLKKQSLTSNMQDASSDLQSVIQDHNLQLMRYPTVPSHRPLIRISINIFTDLKEIAHVARVLRSYLEEKAS